MRRVRGGGEGDGGRQDIKCPHRGCVETDGDAEREVEMKGGERRSKRNRGLLKQG